MKESNSLVKELFFPALASVGLAYFSVQMLRDVYTRGTTMTLSMWIAAAVMIAGAVYAAYLSWTRYRRWKAETARAEEEPVPAPAAPEKTVYIPDPDSGLEDAAAMFARLILGNRGLMAQFKKVTYPRVFESYCCQLEEGLAHLRLYEGDSDALDHLAALTLELLQQDWKARKVKAPDFTDQLVVTVYLVPALVHSGEEAAMDFARSLRSAWQRHYPQSVFEIGTYEQLCRGFEKKAAGCFITTAVCQAEGKPDDCYELTRFRRFRDTWLADQPGGKDLIEEYYAVAPGIVSLIDLRSDSQAVYQSIRDTWLLPCLRAIEEENYQACLETYRNMVETLREEYRMTKN